LEEAREEEEEEAKKALEEAREEEEEARKFLEEAREEEEEARKVLGEAWGEARWEEPKCESSLCARRRVCQKLSSSRTAKSFKESTLRNLLAVLLASRRKLMTAKRLAWGMAIARCKSV
jgi:hypothetical protein